MMTGDRWLGDLEGIVLDPADGGFIHFQLMCASSHARAEDNKFGHNLAYEGRLSPAPGLSQHGNVRGSVEASERFHASTLSRFDASTLSRLLNHRTEFREQGR